MLKASIMLFSILALSLPAPGQAPAACPKEPYCPPPTLNPLSALENGNKRFIDSGQQHPRQSVSYARKLNCCQKPFAAILSCSDSRVPPEVLFDQGFGDLFVIRVAGNVATKDALGSLEYAVDELGTKLVVVMGHTRCGAVAAAFCPNPGPNLDNIWSLIRPSVSKPRDKCEAHPVIEPDPWDEAVRKNIALMKDAVAADLVPQRGKPRSGVKVVSAYYDLDKGAVVFK
jgi:carbonic anhydrase